LAVTSLTYTYTLSLHDALPIFGSTWQVDVTNGGLNAIRSLAPTAASAIVEERTQGGPFASLAEFRRRMQGQVLSQDLTLLIHSGDRKSTRLNSSHSQISYAVFC